MSDPVTVLAEIIEDPAWLVGGAVRDRLLGRQTADLDVAVSGDPGEVARRLARAMPGHPFELSETFGAWRVVARDRRWQVDLLPLGGESIVEDLAARDLTVNAIAEPLQGGDHVDPFGGCDDLRAGVLRMVSGQAFLADPLRTLRAARLGCELGFAVEPSTKRAARAAAPRLSDVAPERVFAELKRILTAPEALRGLQLMAELAATPVILPELAQLEGVEQSRYHHLDVHDHTSVVLAETIALTSAPEELFGETGPAISAMLAEPLSGELTRGQALRFGALLHDIAKPQTRGVGEGGRVTFLGHDEAGAEVAKVILGRLHAGERLAEFVAALVRQHLRLGFLVHEMPLSPRALYGYLRTCDPVQVEVTLLSVADRLATRGRNSEQAISRHLELARQLMPAALAWRQAPPRPPLRGDELVRELGLQPGPELGRVLAELELEAFAGELQDRDQALQRARALLERGVGPDR